MAGGTAMSTCANLQLRTKKFVLTNACFCIEKRFPRVNATLIVNSKGSQHIKQSSLKCQCFRTLVGSDGSMPLNWVPVIDQALLLASVVFAYMAGAIPTGQSNLRRVLHEEDGTSTATTSGSCETRQKNANPESIWNEVNGKLVAAMGDSYNGDMDRELTGCQNLSRKHPLSLYAIPEAPRFRLLWATIHLLQKEVYSISGVFRLSDRGAWLKVISDTLQCSLHRACSLWLEEVCLENKDHVKIIVARLSERLKGDDTIIRNIRKSGKEELYADSLFYLRFGSFSAYCQYDNKLLIQNGIDILEDLVITMADGIASTYLEFISVDSKISTEMITSGLTLCSLSTRSLQKLRNEVLLKQWLHQNIESVVSMYEDRFDLFILSIEQLERPRRMLSWKFDWWKILALKKSSASSLLHYVFISQLCLPVKRTMELRALTGWRYYFSLFLEFSDIAMPFVRAVTSKISDAVSFFLVCLIGRSLGLIYSGIRQAVGWK
ncbi:hypothetical protein H6P81_012320 [Aristolochia fimbriata]|uniref:Uncharacterized protein n=1 Tax=Aristolochia fimbriata TaxID=158543 RepID=A0AAV7EEQ7_ARIFI|nr:hypothetical protein H6P81_012320 [Aristolochia fimbriata]